MKGGVAATALGLLLLTAALPAQAFCLTHGCNDRTQNCEYDEHNCLLTGPLLHWASTCVSFDLQKDGSMLRDISYDDAHAAIVRGFEQWLNADCGGGIHPSILVSDYGPIDCHTAEYNQEAPNANIFMFRDDDWPYENAIDTLALTTLIFNADSGEIYDADVEVNTFQSPMSLANIGPNDVDFNSVITHEIGHFLGLSHSDAYGATMDPNYSPGQTAMASIEQDDVDGICTALPMNRPTSSTSCDPRHGFSRECGPPPLGYTECSYSPAHGGGAGSLLLGLWGLSSRWLRKRARPSSRRA